MHLKIAVYLLFWNCVAVSWEALRSSEISLCGSLHGKSSQNTLIFVLPDYCIMFFFLN